MAPLPPLTAESLLAHAAFVRSVARATLKGDDLVEDAVQDTYLAALEHAHTRKGALRPWLGGVARRKAALLIRGRAASRRREAHAARPERVASVAETAARAETGRRLIDAVLDLDEPYRGTILLRFYEGLPPREVAKRLDVPVETVRTRVKRGLRRLRDVLEEREGRNWRAALTPLATAPLGKASATVGSVIVWKKLLPIIGCVLLLAGVAVWVLRGGATADEPDPAGVSIGSDTSDDSSQSTPTLAGNPKSPIAARVVDRDLDLHGIVVDGQGQPVAGARLTTFTLPWMRATLLPDLSQWTEEVAGPGTTSSADGRFAIRVARHSRWNLRATAPQHAARVLALVSAGERVRIVLGESAALRVRVADPGGSPVANATVGLARLPEKGGTYAAMRGVTDAQGHAVFRGLPTDNEITLYASHPQHGVTMAKTTLKGQGEQTLDMSIRAGAVIRGAVVDEATGAPVSGARVGFLWNFFVETKTDAQGTFELAGWTRGLDELHVTADGYARTVAPIQEAGALDVSLTPAPGHVRGRVLGADGRPIAHAPVAAFLDAEILSSATRLLSNAFTKTADDGHFTLHNLHPGGGQMLHVMAPGHAHLRKAMGKIGEGLDLGDLVLARGRVIAGLLRGEDGEPLARHALQLVQQATTTGLSDGDRSREVAYSDDLGRFAFSDLAPGTYTVTAVASQIRRVVDVNAQDQLDIVLGGTTSTQRLVTVVDDEGEPVEGVRVDFSGPTDQLGQGVSDARGRVAVQTRAEPQRVFLWLDQERRERFRAPPQVAWPAGEQELRVTLQRVIAIRGVLVREDGSPLPHAMLHARRAGIYVSSGWSDDEGRFVITVTSAESVDVDVTGDVQTKFPVRDGEMKVEKRPLGGGAKNVHPGRRDLRIVARMLAQDRSLTVRVVDADGNAAAGAVVALSYAGRQTVDANGYAKFERLTARPHPIYISPPENTLTLLIPKTVEPVTPSGQEIVVRMEKYLRVEGRAEAGGAPVAGARVSIDVEDVFSNARTDEQGGFFLLVRPSDLPTTIRVKHRTKDGTELEGAIRFERTSPLDPVIQLERR